LNNIKYLIFKKRKKKKEKRNYVTVQHVKGDANKVAHILAKYALFQFLNKVWIEVYPSIIQYIVLAEQTNDSYIYIY
jgi:hypothetical protein